MFHLLLGQVQIEAAIKQRRKLDNIMKQFGEFLVIGSNGIDVDASVAAFRTELESAKEEQAETFVKVASFVDEVLHENAGTRTNMDYVTGSVARLMGATASNFSETKKLVGDYIRSNACGEKNGEPVHSKTGAILSAPRKFFVGKGPGGGVSTWEARIADKA